MAPLRTIRQPPDARPAAAGARTRLRRGLALVLAGLLLAGCGSVLPAHLVGNDNLTALVSVNRFPIYWVGGTFEKLSLTNIAHDYGGAFSLQYGNCSLGGQAVCVAPLVIVTTPEGSLSTGPQSGSGALRERGVTGLMGEKGRTIELATGKVVVDIYAQTAALARAAAATIAPINRLGTPSSNLPAPAPP